MSKRKRPQKPEKPFYTVHREIAKRLSEAGGFDPELIRSDDHQPDLRDWVTRSNDALIDRHPHLVMQRKIGGRDQMVLAGQRISEKRRENELSEDAFWQAISACGIVSILKREQAWNPGGKKRAFCSVKLHVFYSNHRWTPADEMLASEYQTKDGRARMMQLRADCRKVSVELRWLVGLSECIDRNHDMPDEMRDRILRAAGSSSPERHRGWLEGFADDWLNEAAFRLEQAPALRRLKEEAFQLDWYDEVMKQIGDNAAVLWDVGSELFSIAFPGKKYRTPGYYRDVVKKRLRRRDLAKST